MPVFDGVDVTSEARKKNADPNRVIPATCKKLAGYKCPKSTTPGPQSTSCINGFCKCNDPTANAIGGKFLDAVAAVGNAPITKAIGNLMKGIATLKEVAGTIAGAVLGPQAKAALKIALNAIPDTGPSFIDGTAKILTVTL
ncbi:hypothetical protein DXG01_011244 [Tephrocybe rancida]|nr:hypothetical protein DXG01_011244 [Tephrocybe rancida]